MKEEQEEPDVATFEACQESRLEENPEPKQRPSSHPALGCATSAAGRVPAPFLRRV